MKFLMAGDGEAIVVSAKGGSEGAEGVLGVVAGADRFAEGCNAACLQAGEEDGGFDLGAGDGGVEVDGVERAAVDGDGGVAFDEVHLCAHLAEGLADALHGAEGEGVVADEREGVGVGSDEAGEHTHGGAGVATVEWSGWLLEGAGDSGDVDGFVGVVDDFCAEGFHAGEGGVWVGTGGEVGEPGGAFGKAGQHGVAVGDGFVAGESEGALQVAGGANDLGGH